jgi:hypothetical protein
MGLSPVDDCDKRQTQKEQQGSVDRSLGIVDHFPTLVYDDGRLSCLNTPSNIEGFHHRGRGSGGGDCKST